LASWWQEGILLLFFRPVARLWENVIPQPDTKKFKLLNQKMSNGCDALILSILTASQAAD
jgi:hypothetical protein